MLFKPSPYPQVQAAQAQGQAQLGAARQQNLAAANQASGNTGSVIAAQPGVFANVLGNNYGTYGQGFAAYANALTGLANMAGNQQAAMGQAESARQHSLGQMGTAAMAGYGNAALGAQNAWAANQTAMAKAMADMAAANQMAVGSYGVGQAGALAQLGNSYANAGTGFANARANLGNSYAQLGGAGANAYGNLAGALGTAGAGLGSSAIQGLSNLRGTAANAMSGVRQSANNAFGQIGAGASGAYGQLGNAASNAMGNIGGSAVNAAGNLGGSANNAFANLGGSVANAAGGIGQAAAQGMSNLGAAGQSTLGMLGQAGAGMAGAFGNAAANVAANSTQFTRDMAKLGLARELGLNQINVSNRLAGGLLGGGGGGGSGGISISSPEGQIASGGYGNYYGTDVPGGSDYGGGGSGGSPADLDPYGNREWYQSPQYYDGGGMAALGGLSGQGFDYLGRTGGASTRAVDRGIGAIGGYANNASNQLMGLGASGNQAIGRTTAAGQRAISGNARDSMAGVLGGLNMSNRAVADTASGLAGFVGDGSRQGERAIGRQADRGAADIASAADGGYGYLRGVGAQGFGGIGSALGDAYGGLRGESDAMTAAQRDTFGGLGGLRSDIANSPVLGALMGGYGTGMGALNDMYNTSRNDPMNMLRESYRGLADLNAMNIGASQSGMGQFYDFARQSQNAADQYGGMLRSGWDEMGLGFGTANQGVNNLWTQAWGDNPMFQSPLERTQADIAATEARRQAAGKAPAPRRPNMTISYGR